MLIQQDFDLNSVHACNGPPLEALRKTMINQEIIFRTQVHELHRLHSTQKILMQNFSQNKSEEHNLGKSCTEPSMLPLCTNLTRYEPLAKEARCSSVSSMLANEVCLHDTKQKFFGGCQDVFYKFQHRPSAVQYIDHVVEDLKLPDAEELTLSLCFGEDNRRKGIAKRNSLELKTCVFSQNFIDLEESTELVSNEDSEHAASSKFVVTTMSMDSSEKLESHDSALIVPIISSSAKKEPLQGSVKGNSFLHEDRRDLFNLDSSSSHGDIFNGNFPAKDQPMNLPVHGNLDLNKDDSSCYSNGPIMAHPSTESSSVASVNGLVGRQDDGSPCSIFQTKEYSKCSKKTSDMLPQDGARKFLFIDLNSNCEKMELSLGDSQVNKLSGNEVDLAFEDVSKPKTAHYEVSGKEKIDFCSNYGSSLEFSRSNIHKCEATRMVNHEKGKQEDIEVSNSNPCQIISKDGHGDLSSDSGKTPHCIDNEDTAKSEVELGNPSSTDELFENQIGSEVPILEMVSDEQNQRSLCRIEVKHQCFKNEDSDAVDVLIQEAAQSLLCISLDNSACYKTHSTKDEGSQEFETKKENPEISDFFELMTLLTETSADAFPSKPHEVNFLEKKDRVVNIRRGRRLKNFQKDILPGLASLSRHEIREDINIMEGVLRSREYKKMRAGMVDGQSWRTPRKSRRSQVNHTG